MQKMYKEDSLDVLKNPVKLCNFINEVLNGERSYFWCGTKPKPQKYTTKVVGDDFEKRIFDQDKDSLVLMYHPHPEKNRGLKQKLEHFAKYYSSDQL